MVELARGEDYNGHESIGLYGDIVCGTHKDPSEVVGIRRSFKGLLKNVKLSLSQSVLVHVITHQEEVGNVQKGAYSKAAGPLARGAYTVVREHDNGPRTPLAHFFNIPFKEKLGQ